MIAIVNYGMGNIRSVYNGLEYIGEEAVITSSPADLEKADKIILPGVGAFGAAMNHIREMDLLEMLEEQVLEKKKPFLGICLGLQLLADYSDEHGKHDGFGWIKGSVKKFVSPGTEFKLPHMGWNDVKFNFEHPLFEHFSEERPNFYFVHSYYFDVTDKSLIAAHCNYIDDFPAIIIKDNIIAIQFHPEKSQDNGVQILENFCAWDSC